MKRIMLCLIILAFIAPSVMAEPAAKEGLELQINAMEIVNEWDGEVSDLHSWFIVSVTLTNWAIDAVDLSDNLSAQLAYMEKYIFDAQLSFPQMEAEPLIELNGAFIFRIPKKVSQAAPDDMMLTVSVEDHTFSEAISISTQRYTANSGTFEGPGFDTPEDCVKAYIQAMSNTDLTEMISTFAIETLVESTDPAAFISRLKAFIPASRGSLPVVDDYLKQIEIARRYAELSNSLYCQYLSYSWPSAYGEFDMSPLQLSEEEDVNAFMDLMSSTAFLEAMRSAELIGFVPPEQVPDMYYHETNQANLARQAKVYGADELRDIAAIIEMNESQYLLLIQCARYGDTWYNMTLSGTLANLMGLSSFQAGLAGPFDSVVDILG